MTFLKTGGVFTDESHRDVDQLQAARRAIDQVRLVVRTLGVHALLRHLCLNRLCCRICGVIPTLSRMRSCAQPSGTCVVVKVIALSWRIGRDRATSKMSKPVIASGYRGVVRCQPRPCSRPVQPPRNGFAQVGCRCPRFLGCGGVWVVWSEQHDKVQLAQARSRVQASARQAWMASR